MRAAVLATASLLFAVGAARADGPADEAAVRDLAARWEASWNRHDAVALAGVLSEGVYFTSVLGPAGYGRGKAGFVESHAAMFQTAFSKSVWRNDKVEVDFVRPDVAVAHVFWSTEGDVVRHLPPGTPRTGKFIWVVEKQGDGWRVVAAQNTEAPPVAAAPRP